MTQNKVTLSCNAGYSRDNGPSLGGAGHGGPGGGGAGSQYARTRFITAYTCTQAEEIIGAVKGFGCAEVVPDILLYVYLYVHSTMFKPFKHFRPLRMQAHFKEGRSTTGKPPN